MMENCDGGLACVGFVWHLMCGCSNGSFFLSTACFFRFFKYFKTWIQNFHLYCFPSIVCVFSQMVLRVAPVVEVRTYVTDILLTDKTKKKKLYVMHSSYIFDGVVLA